MRRLDRLLALLLGLGVAGAAVIAGIETILLILGDQSMVVPRKTWATALSTLRWDDTTLLIVAGALTAGGLLLLLVQLVPRRRVRLLLRKGAPAGTWLSRRSLNRKIAYEVSGLAQVSRATVKIGRRRMRVRARLEPGIEAAAGRFAVVARVEAALARWPLVEPLRTKVRVTTTALPTTPEARPMDQQSVGTPVQAISTGAT